MALARHRLALVFVMFYLFIYLFILNIFIEFLITYPPIQTLHTDVQPAIKNLPISPCSNHTLNRKVPVK